MIFVMSVWERTWPAAGVEKQPPGREMHGSASCI